MSEVADPDFAVVMQELAGDASPEMARVEARLTSGITAILSAVHSLGQRIEALEENVVRNFETTHFQKIEADLGAIRDSESVNQKLFDSLHQELIGYRDDFVRESLQKPVIRDLLVLFDDLSAIAGQFEEAADESTRPEDLRTHDNLQNTLHFLREMLHRLEVREIEEKPTIDRSLHRVLDFEPTESAEEDGRIVKRVRRGFTWRGTVLRPEEVIVKRLR